MTNKHKDCIRGFHHYKAAWYAQPSEPDRINFGWYVRDGGGGTTGEMEMNWTNLGGSQVPRLCVYDGAWHALSTFRDVIAILADHDGNHITPAQFCQILLGCGFTDLTEREYTK